MTLSDWVVLSTFSSPRSRGTVATEGVGAVAFNTVRRCFDSLLAFREVEVRDSTIWRRAVQDLKGGRGERTYPSLHPSTSGGDWCSLPSVWPGRDHYDNKDTD
jgi:hypothetical protein